MPLLLNSDWGSSSAAAIALKSREEIALNQLIERNPKAILGTSVAQQFNGSLPFLLKVLDANQMLSIQTHPGPAKAKAGFARENQLGIPLSAKNRNYRDANHKHEAMIALTDFWLLCGFKSADAIESTFKDLPELSSLYTRYQSEGLKGLYEYVMNLSQNEVNTLLTPLIQRLSKTQPPKSSADYWALKASREFEIKGGGYDRGIFSIYLLNLVHLQPEQGLFTPSGVLHSYLHGTCIEVMSTSDNVLRGGLTPKHIDIVELMDNLRTEPFSPEILSGKQVSSHEAKYPTPASEFELSRIELKQGENITITSVGPEALIVLSGEVVASSAASPLTLSQGKILFATSGKTYELEATADSQLYRAVVPG